jgi:DNA polymerase III epsilon subunit-like protein
MNVSNRESTLFSLSDIGCAPDEELRLCGGMLASSWRRSRRQTLLASGLERHGSLKGNRRALRRARSWRWQPPDVDATVADEHAQQRWAEARTKAITWAMGAVEDPRVIYLDTETTGFGPRAEIVDIAVVSAAGEVVLESLVQPTRRIPADATAIHGITNADVKDAPAWCDLYEDLLRVLAGRRVIVYNVIFDRQMVNQACDRYALAAPAADWECAMRKYAGFYGNWDSGKRWYRFQKLERAVLAFGAEPGGHRAAADAYACRAVVLGMAATAPPMPAPSASSAALDATRPWHIPAEHNAAIPGSDLGATPTQSRTPQQQPVDPYTRWARAVLEFTALLNAIPTELRERTGACGAWSVRELVAHCAGWEWEAARRLRLIAADPTLPDAVYKVDGFNAASVAARARQDWSRTLDELAKASNTLARAAHSLPDDTRTQEWLSRRAADFEEHADGLRHWIAETATPAHSGRVQMMK